MAVEQNTFLEVLKDSYSAYYSVQPAGEAGDLPLSFRAEYHSRDEQHFLVKSANIWRNEKNEYCYEFSAPSHDKETAERGPDSAIQNMHTGEKPEK